MTIKRAGAFSIKTFGAHHCGTKPAGIALPIKYTFMCKCDISALDGRGFLFDQMRVDAYFQHLGATPLSCELLAVSVARGLFRQIVKENPGCKPEAMSLELSPEPFMASITIDWDEEE